MEQSTAQSFIGPGAIGNNSITPPLITGGRPISCAELRAKAIPEPTPEVAGLFDFGGMFGGPNYVNPATGAMSCPSGYQMQPLIYPVPNLENGLVACYRTHTTGTPSRFDFGGAMGQPSFFLNAVSGKVSCVDTYSLSKVYGTPNVDFDMVFCFREHNINRAPEFGFGGFFSPLSNNPATGKQNCPNGYTQSQVLGYYGVDVPIWACWKNLGTAATDVFPANSLWNTTDCSNLDPKTLPLGSTLNDKKYVTDAPRKGYVYACDAAMFNFSQIIGSRNTGGWISEPNDTYNMSEKVAVQGKVYHNGTFSITTSGTSRVFLGNGLPVGSPTGIYPISPSDPAHTYDQNPNAIVEQTISFSLPLNPTLLAKPACIYKSVGITLDGVQIDGPLDSSGRDETAYQMSDLCGGRAQPGGLYHRNTLSDCAPHMSENNALVGYALDGFGIYSMFDANGNEITSAQLDECHGTTSSVIFNGKVQNIYHYVLTRDWPYSITCFKGKPNNAAFPKLPKMTGGPGSPSL